MFLIDDQFAPLTDKIVAAVRTVSDKPIRFLVNTHMHPDHTGGNENFGKMGTLIFGHENVRTQMELAGYEQAPPLVTYGDDITFYINGETVYAFKTPDAHTNNDSYIVFKGSNVIHTGDIYRTTSYPYADTNFPSRMAELTRSRMVRSMSRHALTSPTFERTPWPGRIFFQLLRGHVLERTENRAFFRKGLLRRRQRGVLSVDNGTRGRELRQAEIKELSFRRKSA